MSVLPAHQTKHRSTLVYPFNGVVFTLAQSDNGHSNGTALWLGAQCLSAFLADVLPGTPDPVAGPARPNARRPRAIELGSGVGLSALVLASLGWDILATDTPAVVAAVLQPNIARNEHLVRGTIQVRALDWTVPPETWTWTDPARVASQPPASSASVMMPENDCNADAPLGPPFDLILTSDTVYTPALTGPLLRTLRHLCLLSASPNSKEKRRPKHAPLYLALEARDPALISSFFAQARETWSLGAARVPMQRVRRAMTRGGLSNWEREDWEGVEVWKLELLDAATQPKNTNVASGHG
ncbi:hypothetical protein M0805_006047 [Coniferiporia weirii]|nr:hypothetical protein M0805_006047 [Coniferiporia weirii]